VWSSGVLPMPPQLKTMSPAGEAATQDVRQPLAIVAVIQRPVERQPARGEQLDDFGEMLVLAAAKGDLVADDDRADTIACCTHKTTPPS
jgi:hypothetical protein